MPTGHDDRGPAGGTKMTGSIVITVNGPQQQCYVRWPDGVMHTYFLDEHQTEHWIINNIADHINAVFPSPGYFSGGPVVAGELQCESDQIAALCDMYGVTVNYYRGEWHAAVNGKSGTISGPNLTRVLELATGAKL